MVVAVLAQVSFFVALQLNHGSDVVVVPDEDPLALSQEIRQFLDERLVYRPRRKIALLNSLVSLVFDEGNVDFSYVSKTKTSIETFRDGSGNCLSFTNLFIAMARYLGLDAQYREAEIVPTWSKYGRLITFNRHINVAVRIGRSPYVVDLFPRVSRIEIGGQAVSDQRGLAHYYNNKGADFLAEGNSIQAMAYFRKALDVDSDAAFVWANLGVAESLLGDLKMAEECYLKAIELENDHMIAMGNLAKLYARQGNEELEAHYKRRVESFQNKNPYYHFSLGEQAYDSMRFEEAIEHYEDALKRRSKEHHFHFAMAKAYSQLGQTSEAIKHLEKAHEYAPLGRGKNRYSQKLEILAAGGTDSKVGADTLSTVD